MTRWYLLLASAVGVLLPVRPTLVAADPGEPPPILRYAEGTLMSGRWTYHIMSKPSMRVLVEDELINGFSMRPSSGEIACCFAPTGTRRASVWLVSVPPTEEPVRGLEWTTDSPRRLLWTAPEGIELSGPVWWAPDGSRVAVRACTDDASDVVVLDYVTGDPIWLTCGAHVVDAAWSPRADRIAYVTEEEGCREVWVQTFPPTNARRIGESGINLRWSLALTPEEDIPTWLSPRTDTVWDRMEWIGGAGEAMPVGTVPARPAGALWSPDGSLCAALQPTGEADEKQVVVYRMNSRIGEELLFPDINAKQLLCWSPDSQLVLVYTGVGAVLAIASQPVWPAAQAYAEASGEGVPQRVGFAAVSCDVTAGPPSWNSAGSVVAYVMGREGDPLSIQVPLDLKFPYGDLIVADVDRQSVQIPDSWEAEVVLNNMKDVAQALQMYLADNEDTFPMTGDMDGLWKELTGLVKGRSIIARPGSDGEVVVHYVAPSGVYLATVKDPGHMPVAVADYAPGFFAIAYADGHAESFERTPENAEMLDAWWQELECLREGNPAAEPPSFP